MSPAFSQSQSLPLDAAPRATPFPLTLALLTLLFTGTALLLALLNIQWGAAPPTIPPIRLPWLYVQLALTASTLGLWPIVALKKIPTHNRPQLLSHLAAILLSALPATTLAAVLSNIGWHESLFLSAIQLTLMLATLGLLAWRTRLPHALLATLLVATITLLPIAQFIQTQFFPMLSADWMRWTPFTLISILSETNPLIALPTLALPAGIAAAVGLLLVAFAPRSKNN